MPAAKRIAKKPPQKSTKPVGIDLAALRGKFVKVAAFTPEGQLVSVEFFSPAEIFEANLRRSTAAAVAAAESAPTGGGIPDFEESPQMKAYRKRAEEAAAAGDNETAEAYQTMYNRAKWESLSTWSG